MRIPVCRVTASNFVRRHPETEREPNCIALGLYLPAQQTKWFARSASRIFQQVARFDGGNYAVDQNTTIDELQLRPTAPAQFYNPGSHPFHEILRGGESGPNLINGIIEKPVGCRYYSIAFANKSRAS